jgi:hypothetical protein
VIVDQLNCKSTEKFAVPSRSATPSDHDREIDRIDAAVEARIG